MLVRRMVSLHNGPLSANLYVFLYSDVIELVRSSKGTVSVLLSPLIKRPTGELPIQTAPQAAAQALREAIISGELKGGDRVLEQKWSIRLGIGQPTLREALRELEHQGLLRKQRQRGTYVAQLSPEDYQSILEVRVPLEAIAIGKATARLTKHYEEELTGLVDIMAGTRREDDVRKFHDADVLFHRTIWEMAGKCLPHGNARNDYVSALRLLDRRPLERYSLRESRAWRGRSSAPEHPRRNSQRRSGRRAAVVLCATRSSIGMSSTA